MKHQVQPGCGERAGREAEPYSLDRTIRRERGQGNPFSIFPVELTTRRNGNHTKFR